jgi:hypothetical protein
VIGYLLLMACIGATAAVLVLLGVAVLALLFAVEGISYHLPNKTSGGDSASGQQGGKPT